MSDKKFKIIGVGVHTIDYAVDGVIPTLEHGANLSITGPVRTHPGGFGNSLPVASKLLPGKVGAATMLCDDANGREFFDCMKEGGVDVGGIVWNNQLPEDSVYEIADPKGGGVLKVKRGQLSTGMSFVCLDPQTGDPVIFFSPGVLQVYNQEHMNMDYLSSADAVIISYGTLLRALDKDHGRPMAKLASDLRQRGVLTVLDTHSIRGADYTVLNEPLKEVDVFGCNIGEARKITGLGDDASPEKLLKAIGEKMNIDGSRSRMVAVTLKEKGAAVAYYRPGEKEPVIAIVPACKVKVADATGAGDTFKVGLVSYVVEHLAEFRNGNLNVDEAVKFGNAVAASYISGFGTENVRDFQGTLSFMREQYPQRLPADLQPGTPVVRREPPQKRPN